MAEELHVDAHARPLHVGDDRQEGHLQVDELGHALLRQFGLQRRHEAERHVRVGRAIGSSRLDGHLGECDLGLAAADQLLDVGHLRAQPVAGQVLQPLVLRGRVSQPLGDHRVEGHRRDGQAKAGEDHAVELGVVGHLGDGRVGHGRIDGLDNARQRQLAGGELRRASEQVHLPGLGLGRAGEVADGDVVRHRRLHGQADAYDARLKSFQAVGLYVEADPRGALQLLDHVGQLRLAADDDDLGLAPLPFA